MATLEASDQVTANNGEPQSDQFAELLQHALSLDSDLSNKPENSQVKDLYSAIKALAEDVSRQLGDVGQRLGALEANKKPTSSHAVSPIGTSTPTPEARNGSNEVPEVQGNETVRKTPLNPAAASLLSWAERPIDEVPNYEEQLTWPDEEDEASSGNSKLFAVSESTAKLLDDAFGKGVPNATRKQWRERYGDPKCPKTRVPKLDKIVKDRLTQETARMDRTLARIQALATDVVGPLTTIVEQGEAGSLTAEGAIAAAKLALKFAGNATVQISRERRKRAIMDMNPKLSDLADKDSVFEKAAPELFGDNFAKEAKEREDQLRCLDRATGGRGKPQHHQNFYQSRPLAMRRGGGNQSLYRRGQMPRGRGRFRPYQKPRSYGGAAKENYLKGNGVSQ